MDAAVVARAFIESDPAGEVSHRLGARPVRIVLMPRDDAAMLGGLAKELIVPEANRAAEELTGSDGERGVPQDVVKARPNSPRAEGVEQNRVRLIRFVRVVLVPQFVPRMVWIEELDELGAQLGDLIVGQDADAGQITVLVIESNLVIAESIAVPFVARLREGKQVADRLMMRGE